MQDDGVTEERASMSLDKFIAEQGIEVSVKKADSNPNMLDEWRGGARHWMVTLIRGDLHFEVPFTQGSAHTDAPTAADVLDCVASDAVSLENEPAFSEWCGEFGYSTDSRKAERTYKQVKEQTEALAKFLGDSYDTLLWKVDRQ